MTTSTWTILWLDTNATDPESSFHKKIGETIQTFTDPNTCAQYIHSHPCQSIYLIVSGIFAKEIVPQIYHLSHLMQIYLFCGSISAYVSWGMDYLEKLLIFEHGDDVLERLWNDLNTNLRQLAAFYLSQAQEFKQRALQYHQTCG